MRYDWRASYHRSARRYSAAQAGELLGVDKATVNRWARKGLLPRRVSKINGRIRYIGADLIKLWEWETRFVPECEQ